MIKISNQYLHRFKRSDKAYLFYIKQGMFLAFDRNTLEYIGMHFYYLPAKGDSKLADDKLNELISKGLLEVID